jgi:hypothetical protein
MKQFIIDYWDFISYSEQTEAETHHVWDVVEKATGRIFLRFTGFSEKGYGVPGSASGATSVRISEDGEHALVYNADTEEPEIVTIPHTPHMDFAHRYRIHTTYQGERTYIYESKRSQKRKSGPPRKERKKLRKQKNRPSLN